MSQLLPTATARDEAERASPLAVLPVGSFEQHGEHLPLATDTFIACALARDVANAHGLFLLPPVTVACSHEHAGFAGTVSVTAPTLYAVVNDIAASLRQAGIDRLLIVNGHGGNYVLSHVVQEASVEGARMALFPTRDDWRAARVTAGLEAPEGHLDMHAGELETSILLHALPEVVRPTYTEADFQTDYPDLLSLGLRGYTKTGVIGRPSAATAEKGRAVLAALTELARPHLRTLGVTAR